MSRRIRVPASLVFAVLLAAAGATVAPAQQIVAGGANSCLEDACGNQNCTANDASIVVVGLGVVDDGCVSPSDTTTLYLGAYFGDPNAQSRYDVAAWIATDTDPNGDGALSGQCAKGILSNLIPTDPNQDNCPPLSLALSTNGPFPNADGDSCGEIYATGACDQVNNTTPSIASPDGFYDQTFVQFSSPVVFHCGDNNPTDGFVDFNVCASWSQNASDNPNCTISNACPGTKSKCGCQIGVNSNVPMPSPTLACTCTSSIQPGQGAICNVSLRNLDNPGCDPTDAANSALADYLRCGAMAAYQVQVDYSSAQTVGCVPDSGDSNPGDCDRLPGIPQTENAPSDVIYNTTLSGAGTFSDDNAGTLAWNYRNDEDYNPANGVTDIAPTDDELNVLGENQGRTMTFVFQTNSTTPTGSYSFPVSLHFANPASQPYSFAAGAQPLTASCDFTITAGATWAAVHGLRAVRENGGVTLEWETAAEVGSSSFKVLRKNDARSAAVWVTRNELPASQSAAGAHYRVRDTTAPAGKTLTYTIVERDQQGQTQTFGPFEVAVENGRRDRPGRGAANFEVSPNVPSPRMQAAARTARERAAAAPDSRAAGFAIPAVAPGSSSATQLKLGVEQAGLYGISTVELANHLGISVAEAGRLVRTGKLSLRNRGQDVAWFGDFGHLYFWGESSGTNYARENVYYLQQGAGQRIADPHGAAPSAVAEGSFLDRVHSEQESFVSPFAAVDPADDYTFWQNFAGGIAGFDRKTLSIATPGLDPANSAVHLDIEVVGFSVTHQIELLVGGNVAATALWTGTGRQHVQVDLPYGFFAAGTNPLEIHAISGEFFVDSIDAEYQRLRQAAGDALVVPGSGGPTTTVGGFSSPNIVALSLADPKHPMSLPVTVEAEGPATYRASFSTSSALSADPGLYLVSTLGAAAAPSSIRIDSPSNLRGSLGADYVVVAGPGLEQPAQALANLRAGEGLSTMVVALDDVYDEFSNGLVDPEAIRSFFRFAAQQWPNPMRFGVLAGKGNWDIQNALGQPGNLIPPMMTHVSSGLISADALYGDFDGDDRPEVPVGRFPATDAAEMTAMVAKLVAYDSDFGSWRSTSLMVADNPDDKGSFAVAGDQLAAELPGAFTSEKVYLPVNATQSQIDAARTSILDGINAGALVLGYYGHGGLDRLADEGLLTTADVPSLHNDSRLPLVTALTCNIGMYGIPGYSSLGEELVASPDGGALGVISSSGLSIHSSAESLGEKIYGRLFGADPSTVGEALTGALREAFDAGASRDTLVGYELLGDPAQRLQ